MKKKSQLGRKVEIDRTKERKSDRASKRLTQDIKGKKRKKNRKGFDSEIVKLL